MHPDNDFATDSLLPAGCLTPTPLPHPRVTLVDLARALGLHHSTVSRALKNDRRISPATRARVLEHARSMAYRPDPMLASLIAYRLRARPTRYQAHLGWITNYPTRHGWREAEKISYFQGALRSAAELGYKLDEVWLGESGMTQQRAIRMLAARNVAGILLIPPPRVRAHLSRDWHQFAAVVFGRIFAGPVFHSVNNDHFRSFALLMRRLRGLGYRRPGFACWPDVHERVGRTWAAAFTEFQPVPKAKPIPVLLRKPWTENACRQWFDRYRPDVVISNDETVLRWMEGWGLRVPADFGFVLAARHAEASAHCAGIDENNESVGESAVKVLAGIIQRGESGPPAIPVSTLIQGTWCDGETVRRINRSPDAGLSRPVQSHQ